MLHDVFICHASEDKDDFVRPLAEALTGHHIDVWYDEYALTVGDSLREAIDKGLASSRFGLVILSRAFFQKGWPKRELNGLVSREISEDRRLIIPVWHEIEHADVLRFSPPLADVVASSSKNGIDQVVSDLLRKLRPEDSPLLIARDFLMAKGVPPPVVTDEWWLDIVEIKESQFLYPDLNNSWRWIFPLPFPDGYRGKQRGLNIAWTALQLDWADDARTRSICQLTHPETVHAFIRNWPGLLECAYDNPATLALYAPQLTIQGMDGGFEDIFDNLLSPKMATTCEALRYGRPHTVDGKEPLCGDFIAWRHPTFGNYTAGELSYEFVNAHNGLYSRKLFDGFQCLIWLLSDESNWMPDPLREALKDGFRERVRWWIADIDRKDDGGIIVDALFKKPRSKFSYTRNMKSALVDQCAQAIHELNIKSNPEKIALRFVENQFLDGFYKEEKRLKQIRKVKG